MEIKKLYKWKMLNGKQKIVHNTFCGLIRDGKRIIGCGKKATLKNPNYGYYYHITKDLISSVYLCKKCKGEIKCENQ